MHNLSIIGKRKKYYDQRKIIEISKNKEQTDIFLFIFYNDILYVFLLFQFIGAYNTSL